MSTMQTGPVANASLALDSKAPLPPHPPVTTKPLRLQWDVFYPTSGRASLLLPRGASPSSYFRSPVKNVQPLLHRKANIWRA